ncbi:MAG: SRPBCC family protein [Mycobacteriaceae bacterium]|nr:SRPBCC family protein [Mycobacteriaceae bacterium]
MTTIRRIGQVTALLSALYCARRYYRNWGTTKAETQMRLPGDVLVGDPAIQVTEAVYIDTPASAVWPQLQRNPFGFADDAGQSQASGGQLAVGDQLRLAPAGWMGLPDGVTLTVREVVPEQHVVFRTEQSRPSWNAVLSFHVQPHWEDRVRLLARARIALRHPGEIFAMELARPVIAMGTRGWLLGTKHRAERATSAAVGAASSTPEKA